MKNVIFLMVLCLSSLAINGQKNRIELSHYLFPEFTKGTVLLKTGIQYETLLNYNSLTEEMLFENNGKRLKLGNDVLKQLDTVYISDRRFLMLNNRFLELVYHSDCDLYAEHKCKIKYPGKAAGYGGTSQVSSVTSYSSLTVNGIAYEMDLPQGYETRPYIDYWLKKDGVLKSFINMKQLRDMYPEETELFKDYVKENKVKYDNQESIIQLIKYMEKN